VPPFKKDFGIAPEATGTERTAANLSEEYTGIKERRGKPLLVRSRRRRVVVQHLPAKAANLGRGKGRVRNEGNGNC